MMMMKYKITRSVDNNWLLKRMKTELNKLTNQNSIKVPKFVKQMNNKNFGD